MNMNENRDWLIRKAKQEDGCFVSVGGLVDAMEQAEQQTSSNVIPFKRALPVFSNLLVGIGSSRWSNSQRRLMLI
jgi:hypothetical protein